MPTYLVSWKIEIEADTPREAAEEALEIQRDPESLATLFEVLALKGDEISASINPLDYRLGRGKGITPTR